MELCWWTEAGTAMCQNSVGEANFAVMFPVLQMIMRNFWKGGRCALLTNRTAAQFVWIPITHFTTKRLETSAAP